MANVYEIITDRILDQLEKGCVPWQKPWSGGGFPQNLVSKKEYRGINTFLLSASGYSSPYFMSYAQAQKLGGHVRKDEKGFPVIYWKILEKEDKKTEKVIKIPMLRYYTVFNLLQTENISANKIPANMKRKNIPVLECCEDVVSLMPDPPTICLEGGFRAVYFPQTDSVNMPSRDLFADSEKYYSTLFHELTHSSGHESRLNRSSLTDMCPFGLTNYSKEELVAEMGAAFLCGHVGIESKTIDNSAAYIQNWLRKLRKDMKLVVMAAAQAQKAADFILDRKFEDNQPTA